nr:MAG TPA: hypothetical protein [Caudoviricetes sp.]
MSPSSRLISFILSFTLSPPQPDYTIEIFHSQQNISQSTKNSLTDLT